MTILVDCDCGQFFEAPDTMAGGLANCPSCGKATAVPGLRDPLWRLWQIATVIVVAGVAWAAYGIFGPVTAVATAVIVAALAWLASKLL